jgi:hypothetical protein
MKLRAALLVSILTVAGAPHAPAEILEDGVEPTPLAIIQSAFDRVFNYPSVRSVTLRIHRSQSRVTFRSFDVVYKKVDGRGRTLLRFTEPEYLRGNALLIIEETDGRNDIWIYQPDQRRPRRVSASHKADPFYGSDLSFEDLEHHDWSRFQLQRLQNAREQVRACYVVEGHSAEDSQYSKMVAFVERERLALLRVDFFKAARDRPIKSLILSPEEITEANGILKPERMWMRQNGRDAATEVVFERIQDDPEITNRVFSTMRLERSGQDLYKLVERLREEAAR